jgi:hypothetical protein
MARFEVSSVLNKAPQHENAWGNGYYLFAVLKSETDRSRKALLPARLNSGKRNLGGTQQQVWARWLSEKVCFC